MNRRGQVRTQSLFVHDVNGLCSFFISFITSTGEGFVTEVKLCRNDFQRLKRRLDSTSSSEVFTLIDRFDRVHFLQNEEIHFTQTSAIYRLIEKRGI